MRDSHCGTTLEWRSRSCRATCAGGGSSATRGGGSWSRGGRTCTGVGRLGRLGRFHKGGGDSPRENPPYIEVVLPEPLSRYELPAPPSGSALVEAVRASIRMLDVAPLRVTVPLLAAPARAVLGGTDFSIHLVGPTGVTKTELAALVQQHWGAGMDARHLPGAWSSTANSLEGLAFSAKDAVFVIDDFAPVGSQHDVQRQHREADRLLRAQGNAAGRGRMRSDATIRPPKPPRGLIVSTGEDAPKGQSLRARMFILEVAPGDVDLKLLTQCQRDAQAGRYAEALAAFVASLAPRYEEARAELREEANELRERLGANHPRTADTVAHLALGLREYLQFATTTGAISRDEAQTRWAGSWWALMTGSRAQGEFQISQNPVQRFLELLRAVFASGRAHVGFDSAFKDSRAPRWGYRLFGEGYVPQGERIGWLDDDNLYLEPEAAYAAVQSLARESGDFLPITSRTLHKRLREQKVLASVDTERGRLIVRQTLDGVRRDVLHLRTEAVYPLVEPSQPSQSAQAVDPELPPLFPDGEAAP